MNIKFALISLVAICLAACASTTSSNTKSLLSAAGFSVKTPETAKQKELYAAAKSYKVHRISANGKTMYAYKDAKTGTALIGDEASYQRYEKLSIQQKLTRQQYQAAQMEREMSMGWYGAYGPYYRSGPYRYY